MALVCAPVCVCVRLCRLTPGCLLWRLVLFSEAVLSNGLAVYLSLLIRITAGCNDSGSICVCVCTGVWVCVLYVRLRVWPEKPGPSFGSEFIIADWNSSGPWAQFLLSPLLCLFMCVCMCTLIWVYECVCECTCGILAPVLLSVCSVMHFLLLSCCV